MVRPPLLLTLTLALAACGGGPAPLGTGSSPTPQASPREAVVEFMRAVADSNLARMAQLWGTDRGSAAATGNPSNWQQRVVIMHAYLRGSASRVIADLEAPNDRRVVTLEMDRPGCQKQVPFTLVALRGGGWIIVAIDIDAAGNPLKPCGAGGR